MGTNPLPRNGRRISGIGRLLAVSTLSAYQAEGDDSQVSAKVIMAEDADGGEPLDRVGGGPEPDQERDDDDDGEAEHVWIRLPST